MNISHTFMSPIHSASSCCGAVVLALGVMAGGSQAAPLPSVINAPAGVGLQSAGGAVSSVGRLHAGIAPTVNSTAPAVEPVTDSVTNALKGVGAGVTGTGQAISTGGLAVTPVAGVRTTLQSVRNGSLAQVRVGSLGVGRAGPTFVGVGVLSKTPPQGTLATAGVANANALLNANAAPQ